MRTTSLAGSDRLDEDPQAAALAKVSRARDIASLFIITRDTLSPSAWATCALVGHPECHS